MKQYNGINIIKFIMAFAVIAIHVQSNLMHGNLFPIAVRWVLGFAVPFFFISSGFLIYNRIKINNSLSEFETKKYLLKKTKSFLIIFVYWLLIYLPFSIIHFNRESFSILKSITYYFGSLFINGMSYLAWPLWYVYSSAICFYILSKFKISQRNLWCLLLFGLIIMYIGDIFINKSTTPLSFIISGLCNRALGGLSYIVLGLLLGFYFNRLKQPVILSILLITSSIVLYYYNIYIYTLAGSLGIVTLSIKISVPRIFNHLCQIFRELSMWIFFTHMLVVGGFALFLPKVFDLSTSGTIFMEVSLICLLISVSIYYLSRISILKFLKVLIGK